MEEPKLELNLHVITIDAINDSGKRNRCWRAVFTTSGFRRNGLSTRSLDQTEYFMRSRSEEGGLGAETNGKESGTVSKQKPRKKQLLLQ